MTVADAITNIVTAISTLVGLLWAFIKSPMGKALIDAWQQHGYQGARKVLEDHAMCIVTKYQQTLVAGLKTDLADGVLTKKEISDRLLEVKKQALADFKATAAGGAIKSALAMMGVPDADAYLDQLLEGAVYKLKTMALAMMPTPTKGSDDDRNKQKE